MMLDRMDLSVQNHWFDKENRTYIYFTQREVQEVLDCGHNKANTLFADLEQVGLVERKRQGLGRPDMIFVLKFSTSEKKEGNPKSLNEEFNYPEKKHLSLPKEEGNNTEKNKTEYNDNNPSIDEAMDEMDGLCELMRENIEYEALLEDRDVPNELIEEIVCLIEDTLLSRKAEIQIGQAIYPKSVVQNRLLKLNSEHIKYVIYSLKHNRTEVRNIRAYLLAALYNAPATMERYYSTMLAHHTYGDNNA